MIGVSAFLSTDDDHTLLYAISAVFTVLPITHEKLPYDPVRELIPISPTSDVVLAIAATEKKSIRSLQIHQVRGIFAIVDGKSSVLSQFGRSTRVAAAPTAIRSPPHRRPQSGPCRQRCPTRSRQPPRNASVTNRSTGRTRTAASAATIRYSHQFFGGDANETYRDGKKRNQKKDDGRPTHISRSRLVAPWFSATSIDAESRYYWPVNCPLIRQDRKSSAADQFDAFDPKRSSRQSSASPGRANP